MRVFDKRLSKRIEVSLYSVVLSNYPENQYRCFFCFWQAFASGVKTFKKKRAFLVDSGKRI